MRTLTILVTLVLASTDLCFATDTVPFKASRITVDYEQGRKAVFTLDIPGLAHGKRRYQTPKIIGVQFVFSNGKTADIPQEELKGIKLIDVINTEIETLVDEGSWALTVRIENQERIPNRIADDWIVFIFKDYKYASKWLELNEERNAPNKKAAELGPRD